jgi:phage terminase large subunit GpA-like protein
LSHHASALRIIAAALALTLQPPTTLSPSAWAAEHLVEVEGPRAGSRWDPSLTPYIPPIIDAFAEEGVTKVTVMKSAQVGYTRGLVALAGWIACEKPARTLIVMPTTSTALDFNRDKLQPAIDQSPSLKRRIFPYTIKGRQGSSASHKAFANGSITITGANSAADLQSRTIRFALTDEIDQWPADLEGQGSPMAMVDARQMAFHADRTYAKLQGSTPTLKGASLVEREFEGGDQRRWTMTCPHCGSHDLRFRFAQLRYNAKPPYDAWYEPECCGTVIEHWQKADIIRTGRFVADNPEPGRQPSFHISTLISQFTTWDKLVETYLAAGDDPQKLKSFANHWLGETYEEKSDAPDWKALAQRREAYPERVIPADALFVTAGVDVQKKGLYVEIVGWTADRRSYTLFAAYLPAETTTSDEADRSWKDLSEIRAQRLPDAFGGAREIDLMGIDCRYEAPVVYDFVRRHHNTYALRTEDGWSRPAMGNPKAIDFTWRGKRLRGGVQQFPVGSYSLKSRFYAHLRREAEDRTGANLPAGYVHFGSFLPDDYIRQLVSEYVAQDKRGFRIWKVRADEQNHYLDCRILNMALAYGTLGLDRRTPDQWLQIAADRGAPASVIAPLFAAEGLEPPRNAPPAEPEPPPPAAAGDDSYTFQGSWL